MNDSMKEEKIMMNLMKEIVSFCKTYGEMFPDHMSSHHE